MHNKIEEELKAQGYNLENKQWAKVDDAEQLVWTEFDESLAMFSDYVATVKDGKIVNISIH